MSATAERRAYRIGKALVQLRKLKRDHSEAVRKERLHPRADAEARRRREELEKRVDAIAKWLEQEGAEVIVDPITDGLTWRDAAPAGEPR